MIFSERVCSATEAICRSGLRDGHEQGLERRLQVRVRINAVELGGIDERSDAAPVPAALTVACKQRVLSVGASGRMVFATALESNSMRPSLRKTCSPFHRRGDLRQPSGIRRPGDTHDYRPGDELDRFSLDRSEERPVPRAFRFGAASTARIANPGSVGGAGNTSLPSRARRRHADRWFSFMP